MTQQWTIKRLLEWSTDYLRRSGSDSPRLDSQLLIGHVCNLDKVQLYVQFERPLVSGELTTLRELIKRRAAGEPVAYIVGKREFYGRELEVTPDVLIPRPETEHLVDLVVGWVREQALETPRIVDVGTGSGAIAVSLACELPGATVLGIDISPGALDIAARNATRLGVRERVKLTRGDVLSPLKSRGTVDVVVSNPPYLDEALMSTLARDVRDFEPHSALHGGADGLDVHRRLATEAADALRPGGLFAVELAGSAQAELLTQVWSMSNSFTEPDTVVDYAAHGRVLHALRK